MKNKFLCQERPTVIQEIRTFQEFLAKAINLKNCTVRNIDFQSLNINWHSIEIDHTTFIGCKFDTKDLDHLYDKCALIFQEPSALPYTVYRNKLYSYQELNSPEGEGTIDMKIYKHFSKYREIRNINETLWQKSHDHGIDEALRDLLDEKINGETRKCVGFMGGHGISRDSSEFWQCAELAWRITNAGFFVITGGGPGIMEAANMGAYFADYDLKTLSEAITNLSQAPTFRDIGYEKLAQDTVKKYPSTRESLAIPTWFYGHEPSNAFAPHIAKYFSNANREETLLAIALHGVIYCKGSAGTIQEVFADAAQNHYSTYQYTSPMVFFGRDYFENKLPVMQLLRKLSDKKPYAEFLTITDDQLEIVDFITNHPPIITD